MENIREHIYLAALLHDIGKFYQRADTGSVATSRFLKTVGKQESVFCPAYNGRYSHKHVLWTAQFIDDFNAVFKNLIGSNDSNLSDKNNLINLAACHHLSKSQLSDYGKIIKEADSLSSGMDRDSSEAIKDDQDEYGWDAFKKKRMTSILEFIHSDKKEAVYHLPLEKLSTQKHYFPAQSFKTIPDYTSLWEGFLNEFKSIQADTYHAFSETLLYLLQKYTTHIPSSTINFPDVSLYDHLKTTAALAVCLYDWQQESKRSDEDNPFLLIGADLSGIQNYIYQIVSKYAGKNLKGRSFYLHLLSDTVVRYILKHLHLFMANVIYNSGGGFYILAPNTEFIRKELPKITRTIEEHLFKIHHTDLYAAIDSVEISRNSLMHINDENLGKVWESLFKKCDQKKRSKFADLIKSDYDNFFMPQMQGGDAKRDIITGEEIDDSDATFFVDDKHFISKQNLQQIKLGKALRESRYMVVSEGILTYWENDIVHLAPADLGFYYYFLNDKELDEKAEQLRSSADKVSVIVQNGNDFGCNFIRSGINGIDNIYGFEFYGGNRFNGLTFDKMSRKGEIEFSRLGVLRMDVDNLGHIFHDGIKNGKATLSRYAALSRSLDYFFSGYLNTICNDISPDYSFIVYSGGDDVFIVGSWDTTIRIAERIHQDFKDFTCHNPAFSISGGVSIVDSGFPVMKAAEKSEKEVDNAKNHDRKNSFSMMNIPLHWDNEFPMVKALKDNLVSLLQSRRLNESFLSKMAMIYDQAFDKKHLNLKNKIQNMKTYWMLTYTLKRMEKDRKESSGDATVQNMLERCIDEVCTVPGTLNGQKITSNYHPLVLWAFACRWAELEHRTQKNKQ